MKISAPPNSPRQMTRNCPSARDLFISRIHNMVTNETTMSEKPGGTIRAISLYIVSWVVRVSTNPGKIRKVSPSRNCTTIAAATMNAMNKILFIKKVSWRRSRNKLVTIKNQF